MSNSSDQTSTEKHWAGIGAWQANYPIVSPRKLYVKKCRTSVSHHSGPITWGLGNKTEELLEHLFLSGFIAPIFTTLHPYLLCLVSQIEGRRHSVVGCICLLSGNNWNTTPKGIYIISVDLNFLGIIYVLCGIGLFLNARLVIINYLALLDFMVIIIKCFLWRVHSIFYYCTELEMTCMLWTFILLHPFPFRPKFDFLFRSLSFTIYV